MISKYINKHFAGIDAGSGAAMFDTSLLTSKVVFEDTVYNDIDDSHHHYSIDIDHAAYQDGKLYIFDSKYYTGISELNYKQLAYNEILRYHYPGLAEIHNILLLPGEERADLHFSFSAGYVGDRTTGTRIMEQYLPPRAVMEDYMT